MYYNYFQHSAHQAESPDYPTQNNDVSTNNLRLPRPMSLMRKNSSPFLLLEKRKMVCDLLISYVSYPGADTGGAIGACAPVFLENVTKKCKKNDFSQKNPNESFFWHFLVTISKNIIFYK